MPPLRPYLRIGVSRGFFDGLFLCLLCVCIVATSNLQPSLLLLLPASETIEQQTRFHNLEAGENRF